jgi:hypothetical protein
MSIQVSTRHNDANPNQNAAMLKAFMTPGDQLQKRSTENQVGLVWVAAAPFMTDELSLC